MRVLLLIAHGSRLEASNDEARALAARLAPQLAGEYARVEAAFLELAEPSIPAGIDAAVAAGAGEVLVFPYFLTRGRHVAHDVPELVQAASARHPGVSIELAPYLGALPGLEALLVSALSSMAR